MFFSKRKIIADMGLESSGAKRGDNMLPFSLGARATRPHSFVPALMAGAKLS
jgi:hypothetical protein